MNKCLIVFLCCTQISMIGQIFSEENAEFIFPDTISYADSVYGFEIFSIKDSVDGKRIGNISADSLNVLLEDRYVIKKHKGKFYCYPKEDTGHFIYHLNFIENNRFIELKWFYDYVAGGIRGGENIQEGIMLWDAKSLNKILDVVYTNKIKSHWPEEKDGEQTGNFLFSNTCEGYELQLKGDFLKIRKIVGCENNSQESKSCSEWVTYQYTPRGFAKYSVSENEKIIGISSYNKYYSIEGSGEQPGEYYSATIPVFSDSSEFFVRLNDSLRNSLRETPSLDELEFDYTIDSISGDSIKMPYTGMGDSQESTTLHYYVDLNTAKFLSFHFEGGWSAGGGGHGNEYSISGYNIDVVNKQFLDFDFFIQPSKREELEKRLADSLIIQNINPPDTSVSYLNTFLSGFNFTNSSLVVYYGFYFSGSSFSTGTVILPLKQVEKFLTPQGKAILGISMKKKKH
ncbi:MAG: hypothetical protein ACKOXB_07745 [Flavobacteriales bacterium]